MMIGLKESILSSINAGRTAYLKSIINKPADNIDKINELWESLGLSYDKGFGEGKWDNFIDGYIVYYVPEDKDGHVDEFAMMGKNFAGSITFALRGKSKEDIDKVKEYAEKVAKALKMEIHIDKFNIYLKF